MKETEYYIGLMSGTSIDGVDVALVEFEYSELKNSQSQNKKCKLVAQYLHPIEESIQKELEVLCNIISGQESNQKKLTKNSIEMLGELDHQIGLVFANAVNLFLKQNQIAKESISAIGSHGQTICHKPNLHSGSGLHSNLGSPFTLQIGDANLIAHKTGITTVADFRRMDMAAGGQGAPLAPAFHNAVMRSKKENRIILNLGGIANITLLPKDSQLNVIGFDTGPANTLLDAHFKRTHIDATETFDKNSQFAQQGKINQALLSRLLFDNYFDMLPPKSTGREYFSLNWLDSHLKELSKSITPESIQATLVALTTISIANSIKKLELTDYQVYACGGGMHNQFLLNQLSEKLNMAIYKTNDLSIDGDYLEATTFAWLAKQRLKNQPGNLPSVTGASELKVLGSIYHS